MFSGPSRWGGAMLCFEVLFLRISFGSEEWMQFERRSWRSLFVHWFRLRQSILRWGMFVRAVETGLPWCGPALWALRWLAICIGNVVGVVFRLGLVRIKKRWAFFGIVCNRRIVLHLTLALTQAIHCVQDNQRFFPIVKRSCV